MAGGSEGGGGGENLSQKPSLSVSSCTKGAMRCRGWWQWAPPSHREPFAVSSASISPPLCGLVGRLPLRGRLPLCAPLPPPHPLPFRGPPVYASAMAFIRPCVAAAILAMTLAAAAVLAAAVPPPSCPSAVAGDTGGALLNDGARVDACGTCAAICGGFPGCNAFSWATRASDRSGECWIKHLAGPLTILPGTAAAGLWVSAAVPETPRNSCPAGAEWRADYDGEVLRMVKVPTCVSCAAACAAEPGCSVWVFGFQGAGPAAAERQYQCWLKALDPEGPVVYKDGSFTEDNPWVSGRLPAGTGADPLRVTLAA